jgi:ribonuclease HI
VITSAGEQDCLLKRMSRRSRKWTSHVLKAGLIAIYYAIKMAEPNLQDRTFVIVSDSESALQAIANPTNKPGQPIVHSILNCAERLGEQRVKLRFWIPGHSGNPGAADSLAKQVVSPEETHKFHYLVSARKRDNRVKMLEEW